MQSEYDFLVKCPVCSEHVVVPIEDKNKILSAPNFPVSITHVHNDHAFTIFVDRELRIRAVEASDLITQLETLQKERKLKELYIPVPNPKPVKLDGLTREELIIISLANGQRDISEICQVINISVKKGKLLAEKLVREKKLLKLEKRINV